jgi:hypothetical protein
MKRSLFSGRGKKGQVEEMVEQIPYIILTILVIFGIYALLNYATNPQIKVANVQANVFVYRTLYSPYSISQFDNNTGRVYPGIVVDEKFTSETLDESMQYSYEKQISAKLEIYLEGSSEPVRTAYYNKEWYDRLRPVASTRFSGPGAAQILSKQVPIVYRQPGADFPAIMNFTIIIPE